MATVYEVTRELAIANDYLYVGPAQNAENIFVAILVYDGDQSVRFISMQSEQDVFNVAESWIRAHLDSKATIRVRRKA